MKAKVIKKYHSLYGKQIDVCWNSKIEKWEYEEGNSTWIFTQDDLEFAEQEVLDDCQLEHQLPNLSKEFKTDWFAMECGEMAMLHEKKNADYGGAFDKTMDEFGLMSAAIRLTDKLNRFKSLIKQEAKVKDEGIEDTLRDMASYALMTVVWLKKNKDESIGTKEIPQQV